MPSRNGLVLLLVTLAVTGSIQVDAPVPNVRLDSMATTPRGPSRIARPSSAKADALVALAASLWRVVSSRRRVDFARHCHRD